MNFEDLKNPVLQQKLKAAKTVDELVTLAREEGIEISDEQIEGLSGGKGWVSCGNNDCQDDWAFDVL